MEISVLQWNIWGLEDIANVAQFLKSHLADVICLQELSIDWPNQTFKHVPAYVAEQLGYNYYHAVIPVVTDSGEHLLWASGIFSRYPITRKILYWIKKPLKLTPDNEQCAYVEVDLQANNRILTVGTTRMSYVDRIEDMHTKRAETDRLMKSLSKHKQNFIFTGDLNALPGSYTVDRIGKLLKHAGPDMNQKTWTTKPFAYNGLEANQLDWRLDYVFTTPDIAVVSAEILSTDYSDHLPVLVKVKV